MLNVPNKADLEGVDLCFLLDLTWRGQTFRFSSFDIVIYDNDIAYIYEGSLGEVQIEQSITNEFTVEGDSIPIEVYFTNINLVLERLLGNTLDMSLCELYFVTVYNGQVLQSYNDRIPISRGRLVDPIFGDIDMPAGYVTFSIENGQDVDTIPLLQAKDIITQGQGKGKFRPIILGRPCGNVLEDDGSMSSFATSPAYFYTESLSDRIFIASHPVEASQVYVIDQNGNSSLRSIVNTGSFCYCLVVGSGLSIGDNANTKIFTKWSLGGGLKNPSTGESIQGVGDLLRYMVQFSGTLFDSDALEGVRGYLNIWRCDGWINEDINAFEFIENNISVLFPVLVSNGPRGIRPILDLYNAIQRQSPIVSIQDDSSFRIISGLLPMGDISEVCNNLILRCSYSAEKDGYLQTIEIDPRVELYNTSSLKFSTLYAESSYNRYGLRTKIIESDIIGDFATACSIAKDYVRRKAYLPIKIIVEANVSWGWLDLGDIVKVTSDRMFLTEHICQVIKKTWGGQFWTFELRLDDSSLQNNRPVEVPPAEVINTPVDSGGSYDTTNWYYIAGNSTTPNDPSYIPRVPFAPVDGINDPIFTFWNGASGVDQMLSFKSPVTGSITVKFKLIRGGGGSSQPTYNIKLANNFASQVFHTGTYDWVPSKTVLIRKSSTGYTKTDTWSTVRTITKTDIDWTGWFSITETFTCSNEYVSIMSNLGGSNGGWAIVDVEFIT